MVEMKAATWATEQDMDDILSAFSAVAEVRIDLPCLLCKVFCCSRALRTPKHVTTIPLWLLCYSRCTVQKPEAVQRVLTFAQFATAAYTVYPYMQFSYIFPLGLSKSGTVLE